ncbi:MAG: hypothetical protein R3A48_28695 [Polyangiales bacterium]
MSRVRARVMDLAQSFAAWVAERRGQTPEQVLAHQGATMYATRALEAGLADGIDLAEAISTAAEPAAQQRHTMQTEQQLAAIAAALGAGSHEEALATIATLKKRRGAAGHRRARTRRRAGAARPSATPPPPPRPARPCWCATASAAP